MSNPVRIQVLEGLLGELPIAKVLLAVFRYLLGVLFSLKMVNISLIFTLTVNYNLPFHSPTDDAKHVLSLQYS